MTRQVHAYARHLRLIVVGRLRGCEVESWCCSMATDASVRLLDNQIPLPAPCLLLQCYKMMRL